MRSLLLVVLFIAACGSPSGGGDGGRDASAGTDAARDATLGSDAGSGTDDGGGTDDGRTDSGPAPDSGTRTDSGPPPPFTLPPPNGNLDYQLGGAYPPPAGVTIVSRDRTDSPATGVYSICYVNGFQIQPGEDATWMASHPDLILRDSSGTPVVDTAWGETLIDTSTDAKRAELATVIDAWIDGCLASGFQAIEIDNLDSYSRSAGLLTADDNVAAIALFAARAHADGLAIAQKNATELVPRRAEMGTDFVVAEECNRYSECDQYIAGYGDAVLMIEYQMPDFTTGCAAYPSYSIVLRDVDLVPAGSAGYVYDGC